MDENGTKCSTKYVSTGGIGNWNQNETYILKESVLAKCAYTSFDTKKLSVMIEIKKVPFPSHWPFPDFELCEAMVSRGLMKIFMDDGSTYISANHFWKHEIHLHHFKFTISLDGEMVDRKKFDRKNFNRKF